MRTLEQVVLEQIRQFTGACSVLGLGVIIVGKDGHRFRVVRGRPAGKRNVAAPQPQAARVCTPKMRRALIKARKVRMAKIHARRLALGM